MAEIREFGGDAGVAELLSLAGSTRSADYLADLTNWISYQEAIGLWQAGALLTHNPRFPELVGRRAAQRLSSSSVATLLRSLGSPEKLYEHITVGAGRFSTVVRLEARTVQPGFAEIAAAPLPGFTRSAEHCAWTIGLLSGAPMLFGGGPAWIEHDHCSAYGAPECLYRISWGQAPADSAAPASERFALDALRGQLAGMQERLASVFATASDLIGSDDIADVLARITDRAALQVRAPRYLLAVRMDSDGEVHCHHRGFDPAQVPDAVSLILAEEVVEYPSSWLVVPVRSDRQHYGSLIAGFDSDVEFFPQERELLEVYARYAASALDGAAALAEAKRRYDESSALLKLAQALSTARTSGQVAQRLVDAVPLVVDCDRVGVYLWAPGRGELVRTALNSSHAADPLLEESWSRSPSPGGPIERLLHNPNPEPMFVDARSGDSLIWEELQRMGDMAAILAPICTAETFLGLLAVSVRSDPQRLRPNHELLNRLAGISAQATTALQNGLLVDRITHQAEHDQLTSLPNRMRFDIELGAAVDAAARSSEFVALFYLDLDMFKPVNDAFGHDVGDELLVLVAKRLATCTRSSDFVARLGGDEFAVIAKGLASATEADGLTERIQTAFADPFTVGSHEVRVAVSVGRALFPLDADEAQDLLRRADRAMFEAKRGAVAAR